MAGAAAEGEGGGAGGPAAAAAAPAPQDGAGAAIAGAEATQSSASQPSDVPKDGAGGPIAGAEAAQSSASQPSEAPKEQDVRFVKLPPGWEGLSIKLRGNRCFVSEVPKACFSSGALVAAGAIKDQVEGVSVGDEVVSLNGESPAGLIERISTKGDAWNACSSVSPPHDVGSKTKFDSPPCAACDFIRRRKSLGFDVALQMWLRAVKREISFTLGVRAGNGEFEKLENQEDSKDSPLNATPSEAAEPTRRPVRTSSSTVVTLQASPESSDRMTQALERLKKLALLDDQTRDKKYQQAKTGKGAGKDKGAGRGKRPTGPFLTRTRLTTQLVTGEVVEWKGKFGWIRPHEPVDHPKAGLHKGRLYVHKVDLEWWVEALTPGSFCRFHVYSDANSLGAEECTELKDDTDNADDNQDGGPWLGGRRVARQARSRSRSPRRRRR